MPSAIRSAPRAHVTRWAALFAAAMLAGCAGAGDAASTAFVDPFKYHFYDCRQLETQTKVVTLREQELKGLMEKAERDTGGAIASAIAYRSDYVRTRADLKLLGEEAQSKNCAQQKR